MSFLGLFKGKSQGQKNMEIEEGRGFFEDKKLYHKNDIMERVTKLGGSCDTCFAVDEVMCNEEIHTGKLIQVVFEVYKNYVCTILFLERKNLLFEKRAFSLIPKKDWKAINKNKKVIGK